MVSDTITIFKCLSLGIILIFSCLFGHAQNKVLRSPEPTWVEKCYYDSLVADSHGSSNGYSYLLVSQQHHLETKEIYRKYAIKVVNEDGLSVASSIDQPFEPAFQRIYFHSLNIIRKGNIINRLDVSKFEVLRREEEMERAVYDKSLNAIYNVPDVRVGDIIEYSYTVRGFNPVFGDHAFGTLYLQYSVPINKVIHRLLSNTERGLDIKSYGNTGRPTMSQIGKTKIYEWRRDNVAAVLTDDQLPSWYDPFAHIQYTDFESWTDVKSWAFKLFELKDLDEPVLNDLVKDINTTFHKDEDKIKECIRIVQSDIRYLSFSDGIHGYKPHSPASVFAQKYGDCKDKSLLLTYLLRRMGIESAPALVSTEKGKTMNGILPSPLAFNHCIVQFNLLDSTYWVDPTLRPQVGPLTGYYLPSFDHALVINQRNNGLDTIPYGFKSSSVKVLEEYSMDEVGGYTTLEVTTEYNGDEADGIRNYLKTNSEDEIRKSYLNFYAKDYSEISLKEDVTFTDNKAENIITSTEKYLLKNFWDLDREKGKIAYIYARVLSSYLHKPETKLRTMPLAITHPRKISQTIKIVLPENWNVEDSRKNIESDAFRYRSSIFYNDKIITLRYTYETKQSFVAAENTSEHIDKMDEVLADISYMIYKPLESLDNTRSKEFIIIALLIGLSVYVIRKRFR